jgi:glutamine synthetase
MPTLPDDIAAQMRDQAVQVVLLQFTDMRGRVKGVSIPAEQFAAVCATGQEIDGSSLDSFVRQRESDMLLRPDLATFAVLPWRDATGATARVICDVTTSSGQPFTGDPRHVLRRAEIVAAEMGFAFAVALEVEFFVCQADATGRHHLIANDRNSYFDLDADEGTQLRHAIVDALRTLGIVVASSHHEVAPGQHEIDLALAPAHQAADAFMTLKYVAYHLAHRQGLAVTFLPKPFNQMSGSGLHLHQVLTAVSSSVNLFGERSRRAVSELGLHFIAGQLQHAAAFVAITSPLVNSYKRLASGDEAPATVAWAHENRSAFIRVPALLGQDPASARVELRGSDPACNLYLALAAVLRAGLDGIQTNATAPPPVEEQISPFADQERAPLGSTPLPLALGDAVQALSASHLMQETLGEHIFGRYIAMKRQEWRAFQMYVTDWEQDVGWETA